MDAALAGDEIVVTNGIYATGGRAVYGTMTNRVAVDKPLLLRSVNGPALTTIKGYQVPGTTNGNGAIRCVYLANRAVLSGFTLTGGATRSAGDADREQCGGGVWCESTNALAANCIIAGNSASGSGGGASDGSLNNCVLTDNSAGDGGGASGSTLNLCQLSNNVAGVGGGAHDSTLNNCTLSGNWAGGGGGAAMSTLNNCTLTGNTAQVYQNGGGGGAVDCTLNNCTLAGNSAPGGEARGGGADNSTLNNCTLIRNSASGYHGKGGGSSYSTLLNCTLKDNSAGLKGGGAFCGALTNCILTGNSASVFGGAAAGDSESWSGNLLVAVVLHNCTLTGNSAQNGGGVIDAILNNCIIYYNKANDFDNYNGSHGTLNYCCTTPLPSGGVGNITAEPQLASSSHLSSGSPCRGAGSAAYVSGHDIDGESWLNPPSIGCDEYRAGEVTGDLTVSIEASWTNVVTGFTVELAGWIGGRVANSSWDLGDGSIVTNQPYVSNAWGLAGDYPVVLRAYNETHPEGVTGTVMIRVVADPVYYVSAESINPIPPYSSWATAAQTIQEAVDAAAVGGGEIIVTNGVYATGGRAVYRSMTNRVAVTKKLLVRSVNGPEVTIIRGYQVPGTTNGDAAIRCVYLTNGAALSGFTLTNGATRASGDPMEQRGGGIWCDYNELVTNCIVTGNSAMDSGGGAFGGTLASCILVGNSASAGGGAGGDSPGRCTLNNCTVTRNSAKYGGGAYSCTLNNCTLTANKANKLNSLGGQGGGAYSGTLNNCTLTGNSASDYGGGVLGSTLNNCIVYFNSSPNGGNYTPYGTIQYTCTTPLAGQGIGNITNAPLFVDYAGGNLRLQSNSPCINAGNNGYAPSTTDLDGNPRIVSGTVDMGAYEFQGPARRFPTPGSSNTAYPPTARRTSPTRTMMATTLAGVALPDLSHQCALGVATALGNTCGHQPDAELAERRRGELFPGAKNESVGGHTFHAICHQHSRPIRHDQFYGHQRRWCRAVLLPGWC